MNNTFRPLSAEDYEDFQTPIWDGTLVPMDWYAPVPALEINRLDRYSLGWLTHNNDMRDPVVSSYVTIRGAFLAGVLYDITAYRYRFYLSALVHDVMESIWNSDLSSHDVIHMIHMLMGFGSVVDETVYRLFVIRFSRNVTQDNWDSMKPMMHEFLTERDSQHSYLMANSYWDLLSIKYENPTYKDYLLAKLMNENIDLMFVENDSLALFILRTVRSILSRYDDYLTWFVYYYSRMAINNAMHPLVKRVISRCYIRLYSRFGNPSTLWRENRDFMLCRSYPDYFKTENLDKMIDDAIDNGPNFNLKVVQGLYKAAPVLWRDEMTEIAEAFKNGTCDVATYIAKVNDIATRATLCHNIHLLYKEAMKCLGKKNRMDVARLYLKAAMVKQGFTATKAIDKIVFPDDVSRDRFNGIVADFYRDHDTAKAFKRIEYLYEPERKRIVISQTNLSSKQASQQETAGMLDDILREEESEVVTAVCEQSAIADTDDMVIDRFRQKGYSLSEEEVAELARATGTMPSLMIDSINEKYYDQLDDNLIEQDGNQYVLNQDYLNTLVTSK